MMADTLPMMLMRADDAAAAAAAEPDAITMIRCRH